MQRVLLHSGKLHYDLLAELEKTGETRIALVRLEQLYPVPLDALRATLASYPGADVVWVQEEPENQGAWPFINQNVVPQLDRPIRVVARPASAATAAGSSKRSATELAELLAAATTL